MTLLCIDDDREDVEFFRDAIEIVDPSFICLEAANGELGLEILNNIAVDAVFLDINMPVMNGRETLSQILSTQDTKSIPVFMLSTTRNPDELAIYRQMGARECIVKPNSFFELCRILRTILKSPDIGRLQL